MPGAAGPSPRASCLAAHFPFPTPAASLTAADGGHTVEVHAGALVAVSLLGRDAPHGRWPQIAVAGDALVALVNPANAATVGTQLGEFCAVKPGTATLASGGWSVSVRVS